MNTYKGSCHCGKVKYSVEMNFNKVISCNCSLCHTRGLVLGFVKEPQMKLLSGEENLTDYQFNKKNIHHLFCKDCGVESYGQSTMKDGAKMYAINLRCLAGVELENLQITPFKGKDL